MKCTITNGISQFEIDTDTDESKFFHEIAKKVLSFPPASTITVSCENGGKGIYNLKPNKAGEVVCIEVLGTYRDLTPSAYPKIHMTCVDPKRNEMKEYDLEQRGEQIIASYGRIGSAKGELFGGATHAYPKRMYWFKVEEKLLKGYIDSTKDKYETESEIAPAEVTSDKMATEEPKPEQAEPENKTSIKLFELLSGYAMTAVKNLLNIRPVEITPTMVRRSAELLADLYKCETVESFNQVLMRLLTVCPRKVWHVSEVLAKTMDDVPGILAREDSLVNAMHAVSVTNTVVKTTETHKKDVFKDMGINVSEVTKEESNFVISKLDASERSHVSEIYKVVCPKYQKRFRERCEKRGIAESDMKYLWHGSRNENWVSIIEKGLLLNPNAQITGKMFGNGIYFAPNSNKSWGYTSYSGSYWANGNSSMAVMGLYKCSYGKPYHPAGARDYTQGFLDRNGYDCVHAQRGAGLRRDEIVFYDESAMSLEYVVIFR